LNFDSGIIASMFLTCLGLEELRGEMASTALLSNTQEADSLWFLTSSLIGSVVVLPQMVPMQEFSMLSKWEFVVIDDAELVDVVAVVEEDSVVPKLH